jgi:hypothetical protein
VKVVLSRLLVALRIIVAVAVVRKGRVVKAENFLRQRFLEAHTKGLILCKLEI